MGFDPLGAGQSSLKGDIVDENGIPKADISDDEAMISRSNKPRSNKDRTSNKHPDDDYDAEAVKEPDNDDEPKVKSNKSPEEVDEEEDGADDEEVEEDGPVFTDTDALILENRQVFLVESDPGKRPTVSTLCAVEGAARQNPLKLVSVRDTFISCRGRRKRHK